MSDNYIVSYGELIKNFAQYAGDPHGIKKLAANKMEDVFNQICQKSKLSESDKLYFLATIIDAKRTKNMCDVIKEALPYINKESDPENVDDDWLSDFFDKVSKIQSDDLKCIWSKLLSEEINRPNSISKRLLHNLFLMNKNDAENFLNLSRFCFYDRYKDIVHPIIFIKGHQKAYASSKITTEILKELEALCLIELNYDSGFVFNNKIYLMYTNHYIDIVANNSSSKIPAGNVRLTADGQELFKFIEKKNNDRILEYSVQKWQYNDCSVSIIQR